MPVAEQPVARDLDVVEDHERILLVEARRQRPVEHVGPGRRRAVTAQEDQPRRLDGNGKREGVRLGARRQRLRRVDGDLVRERCQRRQDAGAAHHDARRGLADLVHGHAVADDLRVGRLVDGRMNDRMGEGHVLARDALLKAHDVVRALFVPARHAEPVVGARGEARELHAHVVGRAPHEADGGFGDPREPAVAALQIIDGARNHVADVDRLARFGIRGQAVVGERVLAVEHAGQRVRRAGERGMPGHVVHALAFEPQPACRATESLEKLLAHARGQGLTAPAAGAQ